VVSNLASWGAVGSAVAALAALLNTLRTSSAANQRSRIQNLFDMAQQWNHLLHQDRIDGDTFVSKHPDAELPDTFDDSLPEMSALYRVFGFFELLQTSIDFKLVPRKEALGMFLYYFVWWDVACAKADYPVRWDRLGRLAQLREEMQDMKGYRRICEFALHDLQFRLKKQGVSDNRIVELTKEIQERLQN
jgi:hypothetical protein